jgi:predicted metal-dependent phosphoesterase TrpH
MKRLIDLHTHTCASDGSYTPEELVDYAKQKGAAAIAVTDHDTVDGLARAVAHGQEIGQRVIPGIEITTRLDDCEIHLVGLFVDFENPEFHQKVDKMSKTRISRNYKIIQKLSAAGINIQESDLDRFQNCVLTKAHIGAILIERGYADNLKDAIDHYMKKGTVGYTPREVPPPKDCIDLIHRAGGLAFVAHTNQIDKESREHSVQICRTLLEMEADGLETRYSEFDGDWRKRTEELAAEYGKLRSGGSDFHGTFKKNLDLISGYGDLEVPEEYLFAMQAALDKRDRH